MLAKLPCLLTERDHRLLHLDTHRDQVGVRGEHYAGVRTVPIDRIRGSEGRCADFDSRFRPIKTHNRERWLGIAVARQEGVILPLVELVQVGDIYFVRDGNHRISVARAWGQQEIDALVTVWEV